MSARPIRADELLTLAQVLAPANGGRGRPRTVWLRRAASTAYYALFDELVDQATRELVGSGPTTAGQRAQASRWFAHTDVRTLAAAVAPTGNATRALAGVLGTPHADVVRVADAFITLQDARNRADYDHDFEITRGDAAQLVATAADAVERVQRLVDSGEPSFQRFLRLMVGAVKIAKIR